MTEFRYLPHGFVDHHGFPFRLKEPLDFLPRLKAYIDEIDN